MEQNESRRNAASFRNVMQKLWGIKQGQLETNREVNKLVQRQCHQIIAEEEAKLHQPEYSHCRGEMSNPPAAASLPQQRGEDRSNGIDLTSAMLPQGKIRRSSYDMETMELNTGMNTAKKEENTEQIGNENTQQQWSLLDACPETHALHSLGEVNLVQILHTLKKCHGKINAHLGTVKVRFPGKEKNWETDAVLDSGSPFCLMSIRLLAKLVHREVSIDTYHTGKQIFASTGQNIQVLTRACMPMEIMGEKVGIICLVIDISAVDLILGRDFLMAQSVRLDFKTGKIQLTPRGITETGHDFMKQLRYEEEERCANVETLSLDEVHQLTGHLVQLLPENCIRRDIARLNCKKDAQRIRAYIMEKNHAPSPAVLIELYLNKDLNMQEIRETSNKICDRVKMLDMLADAGTIKYKHLALQMALDKDMSIVFEHLSFYATIPGIIGTPPEMKIGMSNALGWNVINEAGLQKLITAGVQVYEREEVDVPFIMDFQGNKHAVHKEYTFPMTVGVSKNQRTIQFTAFLIPEFHQELTVGVSFFTSVRAFMCLENLQFIAQPIAEERQLQAYLNRDHQVKIKEKQYQIRGEKSTIEELD